MNTSCCTLATLFLAAFLTTIVVSVESAEYTKRFTFYLHDDFRVANATVWPVASSDLTNELPSLFGLTLVTDTPLTATADVNSEYLGQMQGLVQYSDKRNRVITVCVNAVFTGGKYKGSSLSIVGHNALGDPTREMSVVAGTGAFRFARGYIVTRTISLSADQNHAVYEYAATLLLPIFPVEDN